MRPTHEPENPGVAALDGEVKVTTEPTILEERDKVIADLVGIEGA